MDLNWPWILGIGASLIAVSLLASAVYSGSRRQITGAVVGGVVGAVAGYLILRASKQPGMASLTGSLFSLVLGAIALGLAILGIFSKTWRAAALVTAGTMIAASVAVAQLMVALGLD
jgi:hypothetical protein